LNCTGKAGWVTGRNISLQAESLLSSSTRIWRTRITLDGDSWQLGAHRGDINAEAWRKAAAPGHRLMRGKLRMKIQASVFVASPVS